MSATAMHIDQAKRRAKVAAKDRRERIATAVLAGFASHAFDPKTSLPQIAEAALEWADALIAELDK